LCGKWKWGEKRHSVTLSLWLQFLKENWTHNTSWILSLFIHFAITFIHSFLLPLKMESASELVEFPLLLTPIDSHYRACTIPYRFPSDNPRKPTPTEISWIDLFLNSIPSFRCPLSPSLFFFSLKSSFFHTRFALFHRPQHTLLLLLSDNAFFLLKITFFLSCKSITKMGRFVFFLLFLTRFFFTQDTMIFDCAILIIIRIFILVSCLPLCICMLIYLIRFLVLFKVCPPFCYCSWIWFFLNYFNHYMCLFVMVYICWWKMNNIFRPLPFVCCLSFKNSSLNLFINFYILGVSAKVVGSIGASIVLIMLDTS